MPNKTPLLGKESQLKNENFPNEIKFGILRYQGNISEASFQSDSSVEDTSLALRHYWKQDEYIHEKQFMPSPIDLSSFHPPTPPKPRFFGLLPALPDAEYDEALEKYNRDLAIAQEKNSLFDLYEKVKRTHNHTCHFCNFVDKRYIEIHHLDGDHTNDTEGNLVAACTLCHRQHHLLWLSIYDHAELGGGQMDDLCQAELNHLQRIAIVMNSDPENDALLGFDGVLGTSLLLPMLRDFSRPLHSFMMPTDKKNEHRASYVSSNPLIYEVTGQSAPLDSIELALRKLDATTLTEQDKKAIKLYDELIKISDEKKNPTNANASDEDIRNQHRNKVSDEINKYNRKYEAFFDETFDKDIETFTLFELAMALKEVRYEHYESFRPKSLYLMFKPTIFSDEQIAYYRTLDYFDVSKWQFKEGSSSLAK